MRSIIKILGIWSSISRQFKQIQINLSAQLDSTSANTHSEQTVSENSSDRFGEELQRSEANIRNTFDLKYFESVLSFDQLNEYKWDKLVDSCSSVQRKRPKSALKKSNDESMNSDKINVASESETILWQPVYTMNTSLMKSLVNYTLQSIQDYAKQLQLASNPTALNLMNSSKEGLNRCKNNLNTEYYNCLNLLLQTPVFATSVHGPLFNASDVSISEFWCHREKNILDEQFNPGLTAQNRLCSWNGAVGTGAGLPMLGMYISSSVQNFIAFTLEILLPMILNLLQVDVNEQKSKLQSDDDSQNAKNELNSTDDNVDATLNANKPVDDNSNDDSLRISILYLINVLLTILNGHGMNKLPECGDSSDTDTTDSEFGISNSSAEFVGLTAQLSTITLSVDWDFNGIEKLAFCISDCLSLRALCSLLASIFQKQYEVLFKTSKFNGQDNIASHFLGCIKEYDVSIRLLSEQITDITLVYYYKTGFTIGEDLKCVNELKLLLPSHFTLQTDQAVIGNLSKPIHLMWLIISNLWSILIHTCPGGLARQILAHVSSKILESAVQQLHIAKTNSNSDYTLQFRDELSFVLGIAKFVLYRCAETISEVLGLSNLSVEMNSIHTAALLTTQMFISCFAPRDLWNKLHEEGFYNQIAQDSSRTFDFSLSNWLRIVDPPVFTDIPIHLMKERPQQTESEIELILLSASEHFEPLRIISLLTSCNYKLSLAILESPYLNELNNLLTSGEKTVARQLFMAISNILDSIPEYADFLGKVVELTISRTETDKLFSRTKLNYEEWPLWFDVLVQLMFEPLERIWIRFKELKHQRLEEDESFQDYNLSDKLNENPETVFTNYTPRRRAYWNDLFHLIKCHVDVQLSNTPDNNSNANGSISASSDKYQSKITSKLEIEQEISNYSNYYQKGGFTKQIWFELAHDIIRLPVINCSAGVQLALAKINDIAMDKLAEHSQDINTGCSNLFYGQHFAIHLVILFLNYRIDKEIKMKSSNGEYENQEKCDVERLQYLILLEYLCSLLDLNVENEEIYACKKRVKAFLDDRKSEGSDSEPVVTGNSSKIFKNIQNLRFVQHKALPDLFFMHEFLHANITWVGELIRSGKCYAGPATTAIPRFQLDDNSNSNVCIQLINPIEEINWEEIYCTNIGLQEL
uniref:Uncharacterized protein n=1 Tax=Trichobilharzia regenti TaxID=157069 RepID=A0AA85ISA6_TRIRE|nr:unnamed protein product [Trichobilharzia regenti]